MAVTIMKDKSQTGTGGAAFSQMLVATDFSEGAEWALDRAIRLPMDSRATLIVAHVLPDDIPPKYRQAVRQQARDFLEKTVRGLSRRCQRLKRTDIRLVPVLRAGRPSVEIMRLARNLMAEITIVGKHGRRRIRDLVIGSTAERITREAGLPVLVVNQRPAANGYLRPAIALDLDDSFRPIIATALRVIGRTDRTILAIHACDTSLEAFVPYRELDAYRHGCRAKALSEVRDGLESLPGDFRWQTTVRPGDPRGVLVSEITKRRIDLIALGTHGHSRLAHALFGSVVDYVLRSVSCDVLVSPSPQ
jgi:nucleotide-binding universal stress UspA family protein